MDRSFLSDANVVAASRNFVCIRLATYEDKKEAEFMKALYVGRSGNLENTTFAILSPDGARKLSAAGRGPFHAFRGSAAMASGMNRISAQFPRARASALKDTRLPLMRNLELALNVAAADGLPLIVTISESNKDAQSLHKKLVPRAWSSELAGQFVYASVVDKKQLKPLTGVKAGKRILVVEPGQFGLAGRVMQQFDATEDPQTLHAGFKKILAGFPRKRKSHDGHVRLGIQLGIEWKSQIPETDPMSIRARQRARGKK